MRQLKQPSEQLIYEFDFTARLGATGTIASIAAATVTARGLIAVVAPLSIGAQAIQGAKVRLRLEGGTDGELYLVTVRITDTGGQTHELDAEFSVLDLTWIVPDLTTPYAGITDFVARFGIAEALNLADEAGTGRIDKVRIAGALTDAQAVADGFLASRYSVPYTADWPLLKMAVLDHARFRLYPQEAPPAVKAASDQAMATFRAMGSGAVRPPTASVPEAAPATSDPVLFVSGGRRMTDATLADY